MNLRLGMLIPGKLHSQVETLDFAGVRTFYRHDRSWIVGRVAKGEGERSPAGPRRRSPPTPGPRCSIDTADGGAP